MPSPSHEAERLQQEEELHQEYNRRLIGYLDGEVKVDEVVGHGYTPQDDSYYWLDRLRVGDEDAWLHLLFDMWQEDPRNKWYYRLKRRSPFVGEKLIFISRLTVGVLETLGDLEMELRQYIDKEPFVVRLKKGNTQVTLLRQCTPRE